MPATEQHLSPASGFTLIEVVVALAIAGLGIALLVAATGSGLQNGSAAGRATLATSHAQSRLAQVGLTLPLKRGDYSGDEGDGFRWQVQIAAPLALGRAGDTAVALYPVMVSEFWQNGAEQKSFSLYSERVGTP
jgi:general secretion pathway protein I